jgi:heat shock protein HtpX
VAQSAQLRPVEIMSPFLEPERLAEHRRRNSLHCVLLVAAIGALTLLSSVLIWSWFGVVVAVAAIGFVVVLTPRVSPEAIMRLYRAERVDTRRGSQLARLVEVLADRAELPAHPRLYVVPSATLNAFATGTADRAAIAVTEGLLRKLSLRQLAGVLAHEMSHVRNNDLFVMALADTMTRFTQVLAYMGVVLALVNVPALLMGDPMFSWTAIVLLYLAPSISSILQLALSRSREFDADREAASITGDPMGLASALDTLERSQGHFWEDLLLPPARRIPQPSVLRTHPDTTDRIKRLLDMSALTLPHRLAIVEEPMITMAGLGPAAMTPRWRFPGVWY